MANAASGDLSSNRPVAVVTGASSGIGFELAKQFAENGFDLIVCADQNSIFGAAESLREAGAEVQAIQADLSRRDGVEQLYRAISDQEIDAIALNAGVGVYGDFARQTNFEDELNLINLNVTGTVHLAKLVSRDMARAGKGRMLFTASVASTMPGPLYACYAASKAFILSFAEAIRNELKDSGVTVTALMPGATETAFFERAGMENTKIGQAAKDDPAQVARDGFAALMAGDHKVVAGSLKNKVQAKAAAVMPEPAAAAIQRRQLEPDGKGDTNPTEKV